MVRLDAHPPLKEATDDNPKLPSNLYSHEPPLETDFHRDQIDLLIRLLKYEHVQQAPQWAKQLEELLRSQGIDLDQI